jgi:peptidoglycan/LPS O-acetylase OafA/YrhL
MALSGWHVGVLCWSPLLYVGRVSYTMYLVHIGVLSLLGKRLAGVEAAAAAFAITMAYATLSWYFVEQPLLRNKPVTAMAKPS